MGFFCVISKFVRYNKLNFTALTEWDLAFLCLHFDSVGPGDGGGGVIVFDPGDRCGALWRGGGGFQKRGISCRERRR